MGTLRLRLALWHACVLSVILAVFAGLIYGVVRDQLIRHHDSHLIETARSVSQILSQEPDCETLTDDQRKQLDRLGPLVLVHEVGGERRTFFKSSDRRNMGAAIESRRQAPRGDDQGFETLGPETASVRVFSQAYKARSGRPGIIQVAQDLGDAILQVGDLLLRGELEAGSGGGPLLLHGGVVVSKGQGCDEDEHGHCQSEAAKKVDDRVWCRAGGHHVSCWAWLRSCG